MTADERQQTGFRAATGPTRGEKRKPLQDKQMPPHALMYYREWQDTEPQGSWTTFLQSPAREPERRESFYSLWDWGQLAYCGGICAVFLAPRCLDAVAPDWALGWGLAMAALVQYVTTVVLGVVLTSAIPTVFRLLDCLAAPLWAYVEASAEARAKRMLDRAEYR